MASNRNGKRLAVAHLIFNIVTGLFAVIFIYQLKMLVDWLAPLLQISSDDNAMRLALFHTIFNLAGVLIMTPFVSHLVRYLQTLFREEERGRGRSKYLTSEVMEIRPAPQM